MEINALLLNAHVLEQELDWLSAVISTRLRLYFDQEAENRDIYQIDPPIFPDKPTPYGQLVDDLTLSWEERLTLILALTPHLRPELLDPFFVQNTAHNRGYTEFGGLRGKHHGGFLPTGETLLFLLTNNELGRRMLLMQHLFQESTLLKRGIVLLQPVEADEPDLCGTLSITPEYVSLLTTGERHKPDYSPNFPAQLVTTSLDWEDLVLEDHILDELEEIRDWLTHREALESNPHLSRHVKPGYKTLFYGPPGTGKTLTACLLGKLSEYDVYRIDLSMVVSKFIGETEKNLGRVFDMARDRHWILFFDEADALFGKRTATASSHDRYANQEVAYLLQRMEDHPGLLVLATNLKTNLDDAFARRFQTIIHFSTPTAHERERLWRQAFTDSIQLDEPLDFRKLAESYELTGGAITNVLRYCALVSMREKRGCVFGDIKIGIQREIRKEGRTM